jgi:hypothetical protein
MPRSYQVTPGHPRPATSDTAKASQAPTADSLKASQLAAGRSLSSRPDVTPDLNSKPEGSGDHDALALLLASNAAARSTMGRVPQLL